MSETIRVLIAGDDSEVCWILRLVLKKERDITVVGHATNGRELSVLSSDTLPHVVVLDLDAPGKEMLVAIKLAKMRGNHRSFVGLVSRHNLNEALLGEMDVLLHKKSPLDRLFAALHDASNRFLPIQVTPTEEVPDQEQGKCGEFQAAVGGVEDTLRAIEDVCGIRAKPDPALPLAPSTDRVSSPFDASTAALDSDRCPDLPPAAPSPPALGPEQVPDVFLDTLTEEWSGPKTSVALTVYPFPNFRSAVVFQKVLEALDGVSRVQVRHFHKGTLYQVVQYDGDVPLEERLKELVPFNPTIVAIRPGSLDVRIEPGEHRVLEMPTLD